MCVYGIIYIKHVFVVDISQVYTSEYGRIRTFKGPLITSSLRLHHPPTDTRLEVVDHNGGLSNLAADLEVVTAGVAVGGNITVTVQASTISYHVSKFYPTPLFFFFKWFL